MTISSFDPVFQEVGAFLYFSKDGEKSEGIPFHEGTAKVAGEVLFKGKNIEGEEKIWVVQRDRLIQWAKDHQCMVMDADGVSSIVSQIKQEHIFKPKSRKEAQAILGFDPMSEEGKSFIKNLYRLQSMFIIEDRYDFSPADKIRRYDRRTKEGRWALFEIAKLAAAENGEGTSRYIQDYGFDPKTEEGQEKLFEIAKIAAAQNGGMTTHYIRNYGFDAKTTIGQKRLFEIAKIAAAKHGWETTRGIQDYGFNAMPDGQSMLFEIAKIAAAQNADTFEYISNYGFDWSLEWQKRLLEIAKVAAEKDGNMTLAWIGRYLKVSDEIEKPLLEVVEIAARGNLYLNPEIVSSYDIRKILPENKLPRTILQWLIIRRIENQDAKLPLDQWVKKLTEGFPVIKTFNDTFLLSPKDPIALTKYLLQGLKLDDARKKWVEKCLERVKDPFDQKRFGDWIALLILFQRVSSDVALFNGKSFWLLEEIEKRDPRLRAQITGQLLSTIMEGRLASLELGGETKDRPLRLIRLVLCNYPKEALKDCKMAIEFLAESKKRVALKDGGRQKLILEMLLLINETSLKAEDKGCLVKSFAKMPLNEMVEAASLIKDIILFGQEKDLEGEQNIEKLRATLQKHFNAAFQMDQTYDKYKNTIGKWRRKEALLTYASGLKKMNDIRVIQLFREFLTEVLEGTFEEKRTALDGNPHLKSIQEKHPEVFAKWNVPIELDSAEMEVGEKKESVKEQIYNQIKMAIDHGHLGEEIKVKYQSLTKNTVEKELTKVEQEPSSLRFEKLLLQLLNADEKEEIKKALERLISLDLKNDVFKEDLKACENLLKEEFLRKGLKVVDSSDPNHFLLMGTEVYGSCQDVGGDPKLNQALLPYMLDGKHRLFLVLDETGKIVARSVARLLVDENMRPVLFLERLYVADNNPKYAPMIEKLARKKAIEMQVPLVLSKDDPRGVGCPRYGSRIKALPGKFGSEYVDALRGITYIPYTIDESLQLV